MDIICCDENKTQAQQNYDKYSHSPMFTADPTNMDELCDYARLTGIRGVYRNA